MSLNTLLSSASPAAFGSAVGGFNPMLRGPSVPLSPDGDAGLSTGALSMSEGVSLLSALGDDGEGDGDADLDADDGDGEGDEEAQDDPADDQAADGDDAPDEDDPASDDEAEEDEDGDGPATATEAPKFWSAEDKATFALAPPEVQKVIAERFQEAETRVYAAKEEAAEARKEASIFVQAREAVDQLLGKAEQIFQGKWDGVDWALWAKTAPDEAFAAKMEFDEEQAALAQLRTAQAATEKEEHSQFVRAESAKLREAVPELADPKLGSARKADLIGYLQTAGLTAEDLKWAGAVELSLAWKAMQFDKLKASAATRKTLPPADVKRTGPGSARPTAAAPPRKSTQQRRKVEAVTRVMKSGSMSDGIAALIALGD